ncbi:YfhD family protein [Paenibacillus flagellatus]|uniref:YfhD family protein n=1 Tax=Paenibacillus flagellatus TaxID=2211139 RepID=A0A2V5JYM8_9BACL|nr:YfhD family protein [Paenibacillus flagellatus]PYI51841.1 YfhD family protein [Paenibacillus flagellatus]
MTESNAYNAETNEQQLPVGKNEDVEYSEMLADAADREAAERAEAADNRQENG